MADLLLKTEEEAERGGWQRQAFLGRGSARPRHWWMQRTPPRSLRIHVSPRLPAGMLRALGKDHFQCHFYGALHSPPLASALDGSVPGPCCQLCSSRLSYYKGSSCLCWERIKRSQQSIAFLVSQRAAHTPLQTENGCPFFLFLFFFSQGKAWERFKWLKRPFYTAMARWEISSFWVNKKNQKFPSRFG